MKKLLILIFAFGFYCCEEKPKLNCSLIVIEEKLAYLDGNLFTGECTKTLNGKISEIQSFHKGKKSGEWKKYYENGQLEYVGYCKNNEIHGSYKKYYQNGKLNVNGEFKDGYKTGRWVYLDEFGKIINEKLY